MDARTPMVDIYFKNCKTCCRCFTRSKRSPEIDKNTKREYDEKTKANTILMLAIIKKIIFSSIAFYSSFHIYSSLR